MKEKTYFFDFLCSVPDLENGGALRFKVADLVIKARNRDEANKKSTEEAKRLLESMKNGCRVTVQIDTTKHRDCGEIF
jgi:hypothetical protein